MGRGLLRPLTGRALAQQQLRDAVGGVAAFGHGGHYQVGTTHRIATGELPAVHAGRRLIRVRIDDLKRMFRPLPAARKYRASA